jgi:hypothetical protein
MNLRAGLAGSAEPISSALARPDAGVGTELIFGAPPRTQGIYRVLGKLGKLGGPSDRRPQFYPCAAYPRRLGEAPLNKAPSPGIHAGTVTTVSCH